MSEQPIRNALARNTDPDTSHEAADSMDGTPATKMEKVVLEVLKLHPEGLTNHEIVNLVGMPWSSVTPRIRPLVNKGLVCDSKWRRVGPAGRSCIVWKAVTK